MARAQYIYTLVGAYDTIIWVGTAKHELISYLEEHKPHVLLKRVRRMKDGAQTGDRIMMLVQDFLDNGGKFT